MNNFMKKNCCDGIYNSFDVHFTSACDNQCKHCIDIKYPGFGINKPNLWAIAKTVIKNSDGYDDILFLGGEPCLYLQELVDCIKIIKAHTKLKIFVTTAVPKTCYDNPKLFNTLLNLVDGINLSVQHYKEDIADQIRCTTSKYDRQEFYLSMLNKHKIRINLNIVKPFLHTRQDLFNCLFHYDAMGFNEIKLSEIQHGSDHFVSFEKVFNFNLGSPFANGCQTYLSTKDILPELKTPLLLKRSCFLCEQTLKASLKDGIKLLYRFFNKPVNNYGVVYENGQLTKGWR
ncbi:MAG: radical SAM protein [Planctomycetes bacterium]|nr:radical SAM protein [Planctomycetota bacterium]